MALSTKKKEAFKLTVNSDKRSIDITGKKFGHWTAIEFAETRGKRREYWKFKCDCGNIKGVLKYNVTSGRSTNCGCMQYVNRKGNVKHGKSHTRIYNIFMGMKDRCYNTNNETHYPYYGGRGIRICDEWLNDFMNFYNWSKSNGYTDELSIDRINVDGDYEPCNCRWVDSTTQSINRGVKSTSTTGITGVNETPDNTYVAKITVDGNTMRLGTFKNIDDAIKARKEAEDKYFK